MNIATRLMESFREELKDEYQAKIDAAYETKRVYEDRIGEYENKLRDASQTQEKFAIYLIKEGHKLSFVAENCHLDLAYCRKLKAMVDKGER